MDAAVADARGVDGPHPFGDRRCLAFDVLQGVPFRETGAGQDDCLDVEPAENRGQLLEQLLAGAGELAFPRRGGDGRSLVHTVAQYGVEERASITGTTGKGEFARSRDELFEELTAILRRLDVEAVILAGPGFTKEDALEHVEDAAPELAERIRTVDTASVGDRGVHEVLKRGAVERVQTETRIAREAELIDELMERIGEGAKVAYGIDEAAKAADYGAVETLLVLDERLRAERAGEGDWDVDVNEVVESVEQQGGDVTVFSHEFDPGQQLANLGGIAALLRYRLD